MSERNPLKNPMKVPETASFLSYTLVLTLVSLQIVPSLMLVQIISFLPSATERFVELNQRQQFITS